MLSFVIRRLVIMVPMVLLVLTIAFFMVRLAPGGPFSKDRALPPEVEKNLNAKYGFDKSMSEQYFTFIGRVLRLDFGESIKYKDERVNDILIRSVPISATLGLTAYLLALVLGLSSGIAASLKQNSLLDYSSMTTAILGVAVPNFVLGPLLVIVFSLTFYWFPPARVVGWALTWDSRWGVIRIPNLYSIVLPALTLSAVYVAYIARMTRSGMLETLRADYIRTARAKGLSEKRVVLVHALRGGILPVVSFTGPALAFLLTGTIVVEKIFAVPGLGQYFINSAFNRDYFLLLGITAFVALLLMFFNLLVDIAYAYIDPRIRYD